MAAFCLSLRYVQHKYMRGTVPIHCNNIFGSRLIHHRWKKNITAKKLALKIILFMYVCLNVCTLLSYIYLICSMYHLFYVTELYFQKSSCTNQGASLSATLGQYHLKVLITLKNAPFGLLEGACKILVRYK